MECNERTQLNEEGPPSFYVHETIAAARNPSFNRHTNSNIEQTHKHERTQRTHVHIHIRMKQHGVCACSTFSFCSFFTQSQQWNYAAYVEFVLDD